MKNLPNVTVVIIDCVDQGKAINAITKTLQQIKPAKTLFFTDVAIEVPDVTTIVIPRIDSKNAYSRFVMKELNAFIDTNFALIIQHDGYVLNGDMFYTDFFAYDYIGARWLFPETERCVGNGGMSLRSKKLLNAVSKDDFIQCTEQEDDTICRLYGEYLEVKHDIVFAPPRIADAFSFELNEPTQRTVGFHGYFWPEFKEHVVIKRTAAAGDVVMVEPLMQYYHEKGYQVVLDTLPEMMAMFFNHPYRIKHISEMNPKIKPIKVINLDMAYESKPKQNVLKTYYEFAGIEDGVLRNSRLYVNQMPGQELFKKCIVFHNSETGMPHRNTYGVNWQFVDNYYRRLGYTCIQVSGGEPVGTFFNAETKQMLMFLLAGSKAVVGIDSGVAQLAVALGIPTAIMTGSVDLRLRYNNFDKIEVIRGICPSGERFCYHESESSTVGKKCEFNEALPPCAQHSEWGVINAVNKLLKIK